MPCLCSWWTNSKEAWLWCQCYQKYVIITVHYIILFYNIAHVHPNLIPIGVIMVHFSTYARPCVHPMSCATQMGEYARTWEVWRATLTLLSCSPNFPRASIIRYTHVKHEPILNSRRGAGILLTIPVASPQFQINYKQEFLWLCKTREKLRTSVSGDARKIAQLLQGTTWDSRTHVLHLKTSIDISIDWLCKTKWNDEYGLNLGVMS